jgi:long-chain fatty acid transport protein
LTRIAPSTRSPRTQLRSLPAALLGLLACSLAQAGGFQLLEQNASGIGNAYAGSAAVADNASTIFFNPAGMTELREREISLGGALVDLNAEFTNKGSQTLLLNSAGNGGDAGTRALVPNAYLSWKLGERLWGGVGLSVPFGLRTEYDNPWVGGAHALHFDVKTININPSLAFKVNETLSLGAGLNYQKLRADNLRTISIGPLSLPAVPPVLPTALTLPLQQSAVLFKADDWSWGWNVGALYKPTPDTRLGISYRSAIRHTVSGGLTTSAPTGAEAAVAAIGNSGASARIKLPETLIISAVQRVNPQWEVLGDVSWTGWNSIQNVDIVRSNAVALPLTATGQAGAVAQRLDVGFRNSWRVALGANYRWDDAWTFKGGLAYDRTPVSSPATTLVSLPDANRTWLTLGAQWRPTNDDRIDFGLARILIKDAAIDNDQGVGASLANATPRGRVTGTYDSKLWLFGVQYSRAF